MKKISAEDGKYIFDLLKSDTTIYEIPVNQRQYSWEVNQLEEYLNDLKKIVKEKDKSHYLGVLSFIEKKSKDSDFKIFEIIDGQQRMVTTLILVSVIRDLYLALNSEKKAEKIQEEYLSVSSPSKIKSKLKPSKLDLETIENVININEIKKFDYNLDEERKVILKKSNKIITLDNLRDFDGIKKPNKRIIEAYNYFYENLAKELKESLEPKKILVDYETALRRLDIILIISDDIESIFLFFDSLNTKGLQLKRVDLIKNSLFKRISEFKKSKNIEEIEEIWNELIGYLEAHDENKFFKYYFMTTEENEIINLDSFKEKYENYFYSYKTIDDLKNELLKMLEYAKIFDEIFDKINVESVDSDEMRIIKFINELGQKACYSFIVDYFYYIKDKENRIEVLVAIEKMIFRRIICKESVKELDQIFLELINMKNNGNEVYDNKSICIKLKEYTKIDDNFKYMFEKRVWGRDKITNYVLRKLEYNLQQSSQAVDKIIKSRKTVDIEHILPDTFNQEWADLLNIDQTKYEIYKSQIGNLALLEKKINRGIKNSNFKKKKEKYATSQLEQIKIVSKYNNWGINEIDNRSIEILEEIIKILNN